MNSKYDNNFKAFALEVGADKQAKRLRKYAYKLKDSELVLTTMCDIKNDKLLDCGLRLVESAYKKKVRITEKIDALVKEGNAVFITLTFTNTILNKTSVLTRRRYVSRYLRQQSKFYVANVDFSPKKHREHYHAVVANTCDLSQWRYGFTYAERVRCQDGNTERVSRYVAKLTNHALKVKQLTTRMIYSRDI